MLHLCTPLCTLCAFAQIVEVWFCRTRSYTRKNSMAASPEIQAELKERVWLCPSKVQTDVLKFSHRELLWYNAALIYKHCCCCSPCPPPSHPPLPAKTCCCLSTLQLLQLFPRHKLNQAAHARSFICHYASFLPSNFICHIVCISYYLLSPAQ